MGCLQGKNKNKNKNKPKAGRFRCTKCGAVAKKKKHLCKPKTIRKD
ncbi:MAG: hypothetical protein GVY16_07795 [Planctomycetes bacterium]|nr:hypothetical protein [Phycisphaerae bacterium]NBB95629.1 hypothetical protein [Planctomycetota bacterium]